MSLKNILLNDLIIPSAKICGKYIAPSVNRISLDNEISLALESEPPVGPGGTESQLMAPDYFNTDPFKSNLA
jgi:hypothetical protein